MLPITIKTTNVTLTDEMNGAIEKKAAQLDKYRASDKGDSILHVEVGKTSNHHKGGDIFRAEMRMMFEGASLYAVSEKEDIFAAIENVKDSLAREILSKRKKQLSRFKRGAQSIKNMMKGFGRR